MLYFRQSVYWDNNCTKDWSKSDLSTKFGKHLVVLYNTDAEAVRF